MEETSTVAKSATASQALPLDIEYPVQINVKTLLNAGAHFGHQTERWNPKMLPFIYCAKNKIHIINLDLSIQQWKKARKVIFDACAKGGNVLFVGTKPQAREIVKSEATRCGGYYVNTRWLGGTLSNFQTVKKSIERMRSYEDLLEKASQEGSTVKLLKKEKLRMAREIEKLQRSLGGIREMKRVPEIIFVVDVLKEDIAVAEARRLHTPVIALIDTNADPETVDYPIACNDDAARTLRLMVAGVADAVIEGRQAWEARAPKEQQVQREVQVSKSHKEKPADTTAA